MSGPFLTLRVGLIQRGPTAFVAVVQVAIFVNSNASDHTGREYSTHHSSHHNADFLP